MADKEKPAKNEISAEAMKVWLAANTCNGQAAAVKQFPELDKLFSPKTN